jgi:REP element-mobilizing transposase RayT
VRPESFFLLTVCTTPRGSNQLAVEPAGWHVLDAFRHYHEQQRWYCDLVLLMPDHLHALVAFPFEGRMRPCVSSIKSFLAKQHGIRWQRDFFDHRLRHDESRHEKADYILQNPVRAKLIGEEADWPWQWRPSLDW